MECGDRPSEGASAGAIWRETILRHFGFGELVSDGDRPFGNQGECRRAKRHDGNEKKTPAQSRKGRNGT